MGEIRYIIIAKQWEVAGKLLILNGCLKNPFSLQPNTVLLYQYTQCPVCPGQWPESSNYHGVSTLTPKLKSYYLNNQHFITLKNECHETSMILSILTTAHLIFCLLITSKYTSFIVRKKKLGICM